MNLTELKQQPVADLVQTAHDMGLENVSRTRKQDIIFAILKKHAKNGEDISGDGVLEILQDGFGFLRSADSSYLAGPDDIYVSLARFAASIFVPAIRLPARFVPPKTASAISLCSRFTKSISRVQRILKTKSSSRT